MRCGVRITRENPPMSYRRRDRYLRLCLHFRDEHHNLCMAAHLSSGLFRLAPLAPLRSAIGICEQVSTSSWIILLDSMIKVCRDAAARWARWQQLALTRNCDEDLHHTKGINATKKLKADAKSCARHSASADNLATHDAFAQKQQKMTKLPMSELERGRDLICATPHTLEDALTCALSHVPRNPIPQAHRYSRNRRAQCGKTAPLKRHFGPRRRESVPICVGRKHTLQSKVCLRASIDHVSTAQPLA